MRLFSRGAFRRCLGILAATAFAATSPGLSGLEVAAHLAGIVDLTHERQPHFEGAGQSGHTDGCQLGTAAFGGRLHTLGAPPLRLLGEQAIDAPRSAGLVPRHSSRFTGLPRAPPA
jgi:hypothetical protein